MRLALGILLVASPALADTFGGFSGIDRPYLVNQDRVCEPLVVTDGKAKGMPACDKKAADAIATLRIKPPIEQKGSKASFVATYEGETVKISRKDAEEPVVTWEAPDPVVKIVAVYASQYEDRVALAYTVRRLGREVTDVVAFEIVKTMGNEAGTATGSGSGSSTSTSTSTTTGPTDPAIAKAVDTAKKAGKAQQLAAWKGVLAVDPQHSEALYRVAQLQIAGKAQADAVATLGELAKSTREDAIEYLVEARFDPAFAPVRADRKYRDAVGLDRKAKTTYERVMGFGGQWEQNGTSCEQAKVDLSFQRDRSFKVRVSSACEGAAFDLTKKGTWRIDGDHVILTIATKGQKVTSKDEAPCDLAAVGDEDSLHCALGHDLEFTAMPTRR
jgi:hypothetical protein